MSDHWAFCERCHRWFYAEQAAVDIDRVRCPVCDASPALLRRQPLDSTALTS
jgi:hypothetical protein